MTPLDILAKLAATDLDVFIHHYNYSGAEWIVEIQQKRSGIDLKVEVSDPDFGAAVSAAYDKYRSILGAGIPEFKGPLIEGPKSTDEIPF